VGKLLFGPGTDWFAGKSGKRGTIMLGLACLCVAASFALLSTATNKGSTFLWFCLHRAAQSAGWPAVAKIVATSVSSGLSSTAWGIISISSQSGRMAGSLMLGALLGAGLTWRDGFLVGAALAAAGSACAFAGYCCAKDRGSEQKYDALPDGALEAEASAVAVGQLGQAGEYKHEDEDEYEDEDGLQAQAVGASQKGHGSPSDVAPLVAPSGGDHERAEHSIPQVVASVALPSQSLSLSLSRQRSCLASDPEQWGCISGCVRCLGRSELANVLL